MSSLIVSLCLIATSWLGSSVIASAERPNFIVIFTDDHGYADLGCQGIHSDVKTPHIDALANGGARMTNGYVTAPQCVPSRAGLLTGQYQNKFRLESNTQLQKPGGMKGFNETPTVAEKLRDAGYATGMAGKWHLGAPGQITEHGFDRVFYKNSNRSGVANFDLNGQDTAFAPESTGLYHIDACSKAACGFIERFRNQPFFFYLAYRAPHVPLDPPDKYLKRFPGSMPERRRKALAMLSAVDDGVGSISRTLKRNNLEKKTLIFIIGDNGAPLKIHKTDAPGGGPGWDGSLNDPLNGEKGTLTEGGIRTPFVMHWDGQIPPSTVYNQPVISLDVAATVSELADLPQDDSLDGCNLLPFLNGTKSVEPHKDLFWRWVGQGAMRRGKWKYISISDREYLFDLDVDQEELHNLALLNPDITQELRTAWSKWSQGLDPPGVIQQGTTTAIKYFDWYVDGKRGDPIPGPKNPKSQKPKPTKRQSVTDSQLFELRDKNDDGQVTWDEFLNGRSGDTVVPLKKRFEDRDLDGNGVWESSEIKSPKSTSKKQADATNAQKKKPPTAQSRKLKPADKDHPNVILILADDLGWSDTTLYNGTKLYQTPNLQRLAKTGMVFTRAYSNSPLCSPTRASILTGQTPARHGSTAPQHHTKTVRMRASLSQRPVARGNKAIQPESVTRLDNTWPTLGKLIFQSGYRTAHFGKWHLGPEPHSPLQHGFEIDIPHHPGPGPAGSYVAPWKFSGFKANTPAEHIEDRMATEAANWIQRVKDQPFFLNHWQFSVHAPFDAKSELISKYEQEIDPKNPQRCPTYAAMVHSLDDAIGTLLDSVERAGIADRTAFIFISDNGGNMYNSVQGVPPTSNAPLRGGKATIYEGGIRVPCVIKWPGLTAPNVRCTTPIQTSDFYPTILARLGVETPPGHMLDGVDISGLLRGQELPPRPIFTFFPHSPPVPDWLPPAAAVHLDQWKLIRLFHQGDQQNHDYRLYNLEQDLAESNDLSKAYPQVVQRLDQLLENHLQDTKAVVPIANPNFDQAQYRPELIGVGRQR